MKLSCKVIEDMLPMYYDKVCSEESAALVEEHLKSCTHCSQMLSDLRESGSIEQDADIVMMLYRPDYYSAEKDDKDDGEDNAQQQELANKVEVIVAKNRHGRTDTVEMVWDGDYTLFMALEKLRNDM